MQDSSIRYITVVCLALVLAAPLVFCGDADPLTSPSLCPQDCGTHGTCLSNGTCACTDHYCGDRCENEESQSGECLLGLCLSIDAPKVTPCDGERCYKCLVINSCYHWKKVIIRCAASSDSRDSDGNNNDNPKETMTLMVEPGATQEAAMCASPCHIEDEAEYDDGNDFKSADVAIIVVGMCLLIGFGGSACFLCFILRGGRFHRRQKANRGVHEEDDLEFEELRIAGDDLSDISDDLST